MAAQNGHLAVVKVLLVAGVKANQGALLNSHAFCKKSISHMFFSFPNIPVLVTHVLCVLQGDSEGLTPLYMAAQQGHGAVVALLRAHGAK